MAAERDEGRAERVERDLLEHRLDPLHRIVEVGVRLVPLEHRELGLVLVRDALVAEVLADLVHALEPSDDQSLEVELGRDAQVEIRVELVRVRHERVRERAAVPGLEDGRLDLDEPLGIEVAADRRNDLRAQDEEVARLLVHEQVEVALAVAGLRVGQAVERVRERAAIASEHRQLVDGERRLPAARLRRATGDADHVAEVDVEIADLAVSHMSWMRPDRSTRSRKTSFPISRRAMTRPARRLVSSSSLPASIPAVASRTWAIASLSGNRFGAAMARESSCRAEPRSRTTRRLLRPRRTRGRRDRVGDGLRWPARAELDDATVLRHLERTEDANLHAPPIGCHGADAFSITAALPEMGAA